MNTTTNTRGVSEAMVERGVAAYRKTTHSMPQTQHDRMRAALEAALSAHEPAAQGEVIYVNAVDDDGALLYVHPPIAKRGDKLYTAPPAQPAERVPEGWKLAMFVLQSGLYSKLPEEERAVCDAMVQKNPYIAASPAPSEGGKGVEA